MQEMAEQMAVIAEEARAGREVERLARVEKAQPGRKNHWLADSSLELTTSP